jgi:hypothetical protein
MPQKPGNLSRRVYVSSEVKRFWTLTELSKRSGLSIYVLRKTLDACDVPIFGEGKARGVLTEDLRALAVRRPEVLRALAVY